MTPTCNMTLPGNLRVRIESERPELVDERAKLLYGAYLPGVDFVTDCEGEPDFKVTFKLSIEPRVEQKGQDVVLHSLFLRDGSLLDIAHVIYCRARLHWLKQRIYAVHSVCVGNEKHGHALLIGHSGSGKSTVACNLVTEKGWKLFSGNKTLVTFDANGTIHAIAGTRTMTLAGKGIDDVRCHLIRVQSGRTPVVEYLGRQAFVFKAEMMETEPRVPIKKIVLAKWSEGESRYSQIDGHSAVHKLYPYFLDYVNADTILCGGEHVLFANPPSGSRTWLSKSLARAFKHTPVWDIAGDKVWLLNGVDNDRS